jgi:hypothetical protein
MKTTNIKQNPQLHYQTLPIKPANDVLLPDQWRGTNQPLFPTKTFVIDNNFITKSATTAAKILGINLKIFLWLKINMIENSEAMRIVNGHIFEIN